MKKAEVIISRNDLIAELNNLGFYNFELAIKNCNYFGYSNINHPTKGVYMLECDTYRMEYGLGKVN